MPLTPKNDEEWAAVQRLLADMRAGESKPFDDSRCSTLTYDEGTVWAEVFPDGMVRTTSKKIEECEIRGQLRDLYES